MKTTTPITLFFISLALFFNKGSAQIIDKNCNCVTKTMVGTKGGKLQNESDSTKLYNGIIAAGHFGLGKTFSSDMNLTVKTTLDIIYISKIGAIDFGGGGHYFFRHNPSAYSSSNQTVADGLFYVRLGYAVPLLKNGFAGAFVNMGSVSRKSYSFSKGNLGFEAEIGYPFYISRKKVDKINLSGVLNFQSIGYEGVDYSNLNLSLRISVLQFWKRR